MQLLRECFNPRKRNFGRGTPYLNLFQQGFYVIMMYSRSHIATFLGREGARAPGLIDTVLLHLEQLSAAADRATDWILASEVIRQIVD